MAGLTLTNEAVDASETGIDITPAVTADTRPDIIMCENELMTVSAGTTTLTVARGQFGTTAATHNTATPMYAVSHVVNRADGCLVYYYADDGGLAAKKIATVGSTAYELVYDGPNHLTDSTTGVAGATLPAIRVDSLANLGADVRVCVASLNAQINALDTAVGAMEINAA